MRKLALTVPGATLALLLLAGCQSPASEPSSGSATTAEPSASNWSIGGTLPQDGYWNSLAFGNGVFVAVGNTNGDNVATSTDGLTWTSHEMPTGLGGQRIGWARVVFGGGKFVALPMYTRGLTTISAVSTDGVNWTSGTLPDSNWEAITYFGGQFIAASKLAAKGEDAHLVTSVDGLSWEESTVPPPSTGWFAAASGPDWAVVATPYQFARFDGAGWDLTTASPLDEGYPSLAYGNGTFVALFDEESNFATSSSDGEIWSLHPVPNDLPLTTPRITFGYNTFVVVSQDESHSLTSTDGINWTVQDMPYTRYGWVAVAAGNGRFVAINKFGVDTAVSR